MNKGFFIHPVQSVRKKVPFLSEILAGITLKIQLKVCLFPDTLY